MSQQHIVHKLVAEINVSDSGKAWTLQNLALEILRDHVLPKLEKKMDELAPGKQVIVLDKLEIDLGQITAQNFADVFALECRNALEAELTRQVSAQIERTGSAALANEAGPFHILAQFLQTGTMPWQSAWTKLHDLIQEIEDSPEDEWKTFALRFWVAIQDSPSAALRMVSQLGPSIITRILSLAGHSDLYQKARTFAETLVKKDAVRSRANSGQSPTARISSKRLIEVIQAALIYTTASGRSGSEGWQIKNTSLLEEITSYVRIVSPAADEAWIETKKRILPTAEKPASRKDQKAENDTETDAESKITKAKDETPRDETARKELQEQLEEGLFVANAGIVLVWPFITHYFDALGLTSQGTFVSEAARERGVLLLHYVATGETESSEDQLTLMKILCALDPEIALPTVLDITETESKETLEMLQAAIDHWGALKRTSPDGLRQAFLVRDGKLRDDEDSYTLMVEPQTIDILLDKLAWGISMLKYPWMRKIMKIEWGS